MIEQKIVSYDEMADFLDDYRKKEMNVNILTVQPHTFEKSDNGSWRVKKYLWVFISIKPEPKIATAQRPPLIIQQPK